MLSLSEICQNTIELSKAVGIFLKDERSTIKTSEIEFKGRSNDLVSRADKEAEVRFIEGLTPLISEAGFIAEEGTSSKEGEHYNWIIDPLDGTTNYLYGIPCYCTSVALMHNDEIVLGVIYDPERNECFSAFKGSGAFLNGELIGVSNQDDFSKSLIATGFPYDNKGRQKAYLEMLEKVNTETRGIRRLGSAAIDMAYVAAGRFDAFYEYGLNPWDCAAGAIIIREAGGDVTDFWGGQTQIFGRTLVCSNGLIQESMLDITKDWS